MAWWQVGLIVLGAIVMGLASGYILNKAVVSMSASGRSRRQSPVPVGQPLPAVAQPTAEAEPTVPDLYAEIEYNRRIAGADWNGEPQSFVTKAWDSRGEEVHSLPAEVRNELTEAYSDMALANSITWLSTEMGRRSQSLDESYQRLRNSVAERLDRVKLKMTYPGQSPKIASTRIKS